MNMKLITKLAEELKESNIKVLSYFGLWRTNVTQRYLLNLQKISEASFVEIVTNGDTLNKESIRKLYDANVNKLLISLYDGPEQVAKFKTMAD